MKSRQISVSQIKDYNRCHRLWWFNKVKKLKTPDKPHFAYGTTLHECAERWIRGNEEPFPPGWDSEVPAESAEQIKLLVEAAIENGILHRYYDQGVEQKIAMPLPSGHRFFGIVDQWARHPDGTLEIIDHKTSGSAYYLLNADGLLHDLQMRVYAAVIEEKMPEGNKPTKYRLRHNQFLKDKKLSINSRVRFAETLLEQNNPEPIIKMLDEKAVEMESLSSKKDWESVDGPQEEGACDAYGGCPFSRVCTKMVSIERYEEEQEQGDGNVSLFKNMGQKAKPLAPPKVNSPAPAAAPATATSGQPRAPWANENCKACSGTGISSKKQPCGPCLSWGRLQPRLTIQSPMDFDLSVEGDTVVWTPKENTPQPATVTKKPEKPKMVVTKEVLGPPIEKSFISPQVEDEPQVTHQDLSEVAEKHNANEPEDAPLPTDPLPKPAKRGRPKKEEGKITYDIYVGCIPVGKQGLVDFSEMLQEWQALLAKEAEVSSYWEMDAFKRRDLLCQNLEKLLQLSTNGKASHIYVPTILGPDAAAVLLTLRAGARNVIEAVR